MSYNLSHSSMLSYEACGIPLSQIDIFHIDASYSNVDLARDIRLALRTLSAKGFIVVSNFDHSLDLKTVHEEFNGQVDLLPDLSILARASQVPA